MHRAHRRGRPPHPDVLTPAEWRVVHFVKHGLTNRQIARRFGVSLDAVKFHVANAVGKLGVSDRAALRTWSGIPKDSALARRLPIPMKSTESPMKSTESVSLGQISRSVVDPDASTQFYRDVVGLPHLYSFGDLAFFDLGGVRLLLDRTDEPKGGGILYFRVSDIESAYATLSARGADFINAPHLIHRHEDGTEEWMAFFRDLEGRPLAIMSQVPPVDEP